ncbi:hypothetical protein [Micromonospora sp. RTP1Z1]|uniref:hypothetical protein n=1 Tax=Micromonospora sp. RTP1Z1 TaxID=2994043 RepID=UPI0029C7396D|nr:hypothetical protein [Micromonospora sp. RTP1Z1]
MDLVGLQEVTLWRIGRTGRIGDPGYTAGLGDDLTEPADDVEHRIDMVMVRGAVAPAASEVFGTAQQTPDGRWASDHLGHLAVLAGGTPSAPDPGRRAYDPQVTGAEDSTDDDRLARPAVRR